MIEGQWTWVVGPEAGTRFWTGYRIGVASGFTAWRPLEPNNANNEDCLAGWWGGPVWNDLRGNWRLDSYVVEYGATDVPTPGTLPLMLGGIGVLALGLRRRD